MSVMLGGVMRSQQVSTTSAAAAIAAEQAALTAAINQYQTDIDAGAPQATLDADLAVIEAHNAAVADLITQQVPALATTPTAEFFMRSDGTSGGAGTEADPVQTPAQLMALVNAFGPGATAGILPHATPGASYTLTPTIQKLFQPTVAGEPLRPIKIRGYPYKDATGTNVYPTFDAGVSVLGSAGNWTQATGPIYTANSTNGITCQSGPKTFTRANGTAGLSFITLGFAPGQKFVPTLLDAAMNGSTFTITAVTATIITVAEAVTAVAVADTDAVLTVTQSNWWTRNVATLYGTNCFFMNGTPSNSRPTILQIRDVLTWALVGNNLTVWATSNPASGGLTSLTQCSGVNAVYGAVDYVTVQDLNFKFFAGRTISVVAGTKGWRVENVGVDYGSITGVDMSGNDHAIIGGHSSNNGSVTGLGEHGYDIRPPYDNITIDGITAYNNGEDGLQLTSIDPVDRIGTVNARNMRISRNAENAVDAKRGSLLTIENSHIESGGGRLFGDSTETITNHSGFVKVILRDSILYQRDGNSTCYHAAPFGLVYTANASNGITVNAATKTFTRAGGSGVFSFVTIGFLPGMQGQWSNLDPAIDGVVFTIGDTVTTNTFNVVETIGASVAVADTDAVFRTISGHPAVLPNGIGQTQAERTFFSSVSAGVILLNSENGAVPGDSTFEACVSVTANTGGGAVRAASAANHSFKRRWKQGIILNLATGASATGLLMTQGVAPIPQVSTWEILEDTIIESGGPCVFGTAAANNITGTAHINALRRNSATNVLVSINGVNYTAAQCTDGTLAAAQPAFGGANFVAQTAGTSFLAGPYTCSSLTRVGNLCTLKFTAATDIKVGSIVFLQGAIAAEDGYNGPKRVLTVSTVTNANDTVTFTLFAEDASITTPATTPGGITAQVFRVAPGAPATVRTKGGNQGIVSGAYMIKFVDTGLSDPMGWDPVVSA